MSGRAPQYSLFPAHVPCRAAAATATPHQMLMALFAPAAVTAAGSSPAIKGSREVRNKTMSQLRRDLSQALADAGGADAVGRRWATALRARYPERDTAKHIARAFGVDPRTAQSWLSGQAPQIRHLAQAAVLHGAALIGEVLVPDTALHLEARIEATLTETERLLDRMRADLEALREVPR